MTVWRIINDGTTVLITADPLKALEAAVKVAETDGAYLDIWKEEVS